MAFAENSPNTSNEFMSRLQLDDEEGNEYSDRWNTRELLCLASAVKRSGDKNWVSVSRAIKPFGEPKYPPDWYTPKNCALQYSKLLKEVEDPKRKPRQERITSEELLVKNLTEKRLSELTFQNQQIKSCGIILQNTIERIEAGEFDDNLDELLKLAEEEEKRVEESTKEWLAKRESLNATKKLNKCRAPLSRNKSASSRGGDTRKKTPSVDRSEASMIAPIPADAVVKVEVTDDFSVLPAGMVIKKEIDEEMSENNLIVPQVPAPSGQPPPPTSPLLTSLLRNVSSSNVPASVPGITSLPIKEMLVEDQAFLASAANSLMADAAGQCLMTSAQTPTSGISPLLTSLLKSPTAVATPQSPAAPGVTPHLVTKEPEQLDITAQILKSIKVSESGNVVDPKIRASSPTGAIPHPVPASSPLLNSLLKSPSASTTVQQPKEGTTPKTASPPQPFFNPTSALATAAAQQLAVATATLPQNHNFFQQLEGFTAVQSTVNSASLSAPTLSKLLEMPPSTPGKLPPLPIVSTTALQSTRSVETILTDKIAEINQLTQQITEIATSAGLDKEATNTLDHNTSINSNKSDEDTKDLSDLIDDKALECILECTGGGKKENDDFMEAVFKTLSQTFDEKEVEKAINAVSDIKVLQDGTQEVHISTPDEASASLAAVIQGTPEQRISEIISSIDTYDNDAKKPKLEAETMDTSNSLDTGEDIHGVKGKKFYKSRTTPKKRVPSEPDGADKSGDNTNSPSKQSVQSLKADSAMAIDESDDPDKLDKTEDATEDDIYKYPSSKKARHFEKYEMRDDKEMSEDETPIYKRLGRKVKRGRPRLQKAMPKSDPKDQYEFTESTEENSEGYQAANTLCYMPRVKASESDDKESISKYPKPMMTSKSEPRASFGSEEEAMSDTYETLDDVSGTRLKIPKKSDETSAEKESEKNVKSLETTKTRYQSLKRGAHDSVKKDKKLEIESETEEAVISTHDSEDTGSEAPLKTPEVEPDDKPMDVSETPRDSEAETSDGHSLQSHPNPSSVDVDKVEDEADGNESSVVMAASPSAADVKQEPPEEVKQEWFHGCSPKTEAVFQSSEDSEEYDSDNSDSHSASTSHKSTTRSNEQQTRMMRKDRDGQHKAWKKSVSIVWREASCHKYANVFLQKVTNDVAPGYLSIVNRPMDLSLIKRNIDNGVIRTNDEFQRDMMLMFQNAIMYNSSDHDVHQMAVQMQRDVIRQIEDFLATQFVFESKPQTSSSLRGARKNHSKPVPSGKAKEDGDRD